MWGQWQHPPLTTQSRPAVSPPSTQHTQSTTTTHTQTKQRHGRDLRDGAGGGQELRVLRCQARLLQLARRRAGDVGGGGGGCLSRSFGSVVGFGGCGWIEPRCPRPINLQPTKNNQTPPSHIHRGVYISLPLTPTQNNHKPNTRCTSRRRRPWPPTQARTPPAPR